MARAAVIYDTKYGNTKTVAKSIAEGMRESGVGDVDVVHVATVTPDDLASYDVLVIGSPNHAGGATRKIKKLIDGLGGLNGKAATAFDTYVGKDLEKATNRMLRRLRGKAPELEIVTPGLSVLVNGMKGPMADGELEKCKAFGATIAAHVGGRS